MIMSDFARALVELVLLGPTNDRRQLQDSPVLGDVWIAFAEKPGKPLDLLITPYKECAAGPVAVEISDRIDALGLPRNEKEEANVAYLQGLVAARVFFEEVVRIIVPMTQWWRDPEIKTELRRYTEEKLEPKFKTIIEWAQAKANRVKIKDEGMDFGQNSAALSALDRYVVLAGIILWAGRDRQDPSAAEEDIGDLLAKGPNSAEMAAYLINVYTEISFYSFPKKPYVWQVSLNRKAMPALEKSVSAVKADAARGLFSIKCDEINWAVLDSGIDDTHPALQEDNKAKRVVQTFDFSNIRKIVSLDNKYLDKDKFHKKYGELLANLVEKVDDDYAIKILKALAEDAANDRPIDWGLAEKLIRIKPETPPQAIHGTHVAGIIGAKTWVENGKIKGTPGMCPDIKLYDFRVLPRSGDDNEFAIISALQYIRYLNERNNHIVIHGANLSLAILHDVRNFACGRTPICDECEKLVESGVVVVAAAGNFGHQSFQTKEGVFEGYAAFSISDPGNTDGVITVGATHRFWPHTYGVSFFSSRGPTGDGRLKPDIVAPGEKINSCIPDGKWKQLDGTSMAAPHVSGAAAMLMARYPELIRQPRRIKRILCESATDLGRERSFQGHGMLDVLRAFQSI
jgi:serine protease AprX